MLSAITNSLVPFKLEDFFDEFEHRPDLINLASSDAQPWSVADLQGKGLALDPGLTLRYPNVKEDLFPALVRFCRPPAGIGLLPTSGAAEAIALVMHALSATRTPRDDKTVGIPSPGFGAFRGLAALLGFPVESYKYHPSCDWTPDLAELLSLSKRCRALIVTNPHNPTGQVMQLPELTDIAGELSSHGGTLIVDEVFRISGETESAITLGPHVVVIGSMSKTYGLPGLRLGWLAASEERLAPMRTVQQYLTLTLSAMTVGLGAAVLDDPEQFSRKDLICENRRILSDWANTQKDIVSISAPLGGTTICLTINTVVDEMKLFEQFVKMGVLLAPGSRCFEYPQAVPWFRLCYGTESQTLKQGLERVSAVVTTLSRR